MFIADFKKIKYFVICDRLKELITQGQKCYCMKQILAHFKENWIQYGFETFVVICGILIAFYLSNWAEDQKRRRKEVTILTEIKNDIKSSLVDLNEDKIIMDSAFVSTKRVIQTIEITDDVSSRLSTDFANLISFSFFFPQTSGYESLKSTGLDLISKDSIKLMITRVYERGIKRIKSKEEIRNAKILMFPFFKDHFKLVSNGKNQNISDEISYGGNLSNQFSAIPLDYSSLRESSEFKVLLHQSLIERSYFVRDYRNLQLDIEKLIAMIKNEIN